LSHDLQQGVLFWVSTKEGLDFAVVVLPLKGVSANPFLVGFSHEVTVDNSVVKQDMVPVVDGVSGGAENSEAFHHVCRATVETSPAMGLAL
jgi:hypothetical protein